MKIFTTLCFVLLAAIPARAGTNLPPARSFLLDDETSFELTAPLKQYEKPSRLAGKVSSMGGGTAAILVNRWAAEFDDIFPDVVMDCHGGGVVNGLAALLEGKVDLLPMVRELEPDEVARFKAKFGYEPTQIVVAQDAEAVYVNKCNPLPGFTLAQLDAIYSQKSKRGGGRPEFWRELGVPAPLGDQRINRFCLVRAHSNYAYFQEHVMQGEEYRFDVHFEVVPSSVVQAVGADDAGVGFASVMFATDRTRFVPLQAADGHYLVPSYENIVNRKYPLVRPIRIVFHRKPDGSMNLAAWEFLRFTVSRYGQRIIALGGSFPLTLEEQTQALQTIGEPPRKTGQ